LGSVLAIGGDVWHNKSSNNLYDLVYNLSYFMPSLSNIFASSGYTYYHILKIPIPYLKTKMNNSPPKRKMRAHHIKPLTRKDKSFKKNKKGLSSKVVE